jgi:16S rRNA (cytosine1402-N4)-methyltransferase
MAAAAPQPPADTSQGDAPHVPVLLGPFLRALAGRPGALDGTWIDGTLGAGGYTRALLDAGAARVVAIDRDPQAIALSQGWAPAHGDRLTIVQDRFGTLDTHAHGVAGVVLDVGVSSMQIDQGERGFSFQRHGPLDMRMAQDGPSAADLVNHATEARLADILFHYGEERAARRIARAIVTARAISEITTTRQLAKVIEGCLPRAKPGQVHPATRSFQALRIAVNDELGELARALAAAERALRPGGVLAVVSFHSLEDRIVKRFLADAEARTRGNRYAPDVAPQPPRFRDLARGGIAPDATEIAANPRARSARLRLAERTDAPPAPPPAASLGVPDLQL